VSRVGKQQKRAGARKPAVGNVTVLIAELVLVVVLFLGGQLVLSGMIAVLGVLSAIYLGLIPLSGERRGKR